jgi:broad specificity phosphatase PhoE
MHARAVAFDSGIDQAIEAGRKIALNDRCKYFEQALVFVSPYVRARQTLYYLMVGAGVIARNEHDGEPGNIHRTIARLPRTYEDPRLREVELGYSGTHTHSLSLSSICYCYLAAVVTFLTIINTFAALEEQAEGRRTHGWFYYRFHGGESPADCFDRTSSFLETLTRQVHTTTTTTTTRLLLCALTSGLPRDT